MKIISLVTGLLVVICFTSLLNAENIKCEAVVEDTSGIITEVTNMGYMFSRSLMKKFDVVKDKTRIVVITNNFAVAIPIVSIISIETKGGNFEVAYLWKGKELKLLGKLDLSDIRGTSDFGDFKLELKKLKKLRFKDKPRDIKLKKDITMNQAILILVKGDRVPVTCLKQYRSLYHPKVSSRSGSFETVFSWARTSHHHETKLKFHRGESLVTVEYSSLKSMQFGPENSISITMQNGKTTTGKITNEDATKIEGFTGIYDKGEFYIDRKHLKTIEFM